MFNTTTGMKNLSKILVIIILFFGCLAGTGNQKKEESKSDMKELTIRKISSEGTAAPEDIKALLEAQTEAHSIDLVNWESFPYKPEVKFRIGHTGSEIWLVYYVKEDHILARQTAPNGPNHKDSCVEFFIDPKGDGSYYNFEFNAIGATHLAYGPTLGQRNFLDPEQIESLIRTRSSLGKQPIDERGEGLAWDLTVVIPTEILIDDQPEDLSGLHMRANFYKCGDETDTPHFLSWNPIAFERPSFHQPAQFGRIVFE